MGVRKIAPYTFAHEPLPKKKLSPEEYRERQKISRGKLTLEHDTFKTNLA